MKGYAELRYIIRLIGSQFRTHPFRMGIWSLCIVLFFAIEACQLFSPLPTHDWLATNLEQIAAANSDDFYFAVFGDNKNSHAVFERLLRRVDHDRDIVFAMDLGDLVYDGEKEKYRYFINQLKNNISIPFLTAIGNHELKEKGRGLYYDLFGPFYYSFHIGKAYFIVLDDANEEGLDLWQNRWLENELRKAQTSDIRLVFMHVPLFDPRGGIHHHCLPEKEANRLIGLFRQYRIDHIFVSHIHGYFTGRWKGVPYTITGGGGAGLFGTDPKHYFYHYLKVHIKGKNLDIEPVPIPSPDYGWIDRMASIGWLYLYAWSRFNGIEAALLLLAGGITFLSLHSRR